MNYRRIAVLLLFCTALTAQKIPDLWFTREKLNGHAWQAMTERERITYLQALREVLLTVRPEQYSKWLPRGSYEEIETAMEKVYSYRPNLDIPILNALTIVIDNQKK